MSISMLRSCPPIHALQRSANRCVRGYKLGVVAPLLLKESVNRPHPQVTKPIYHGRMGTNDKMS